MKFNFRRFERNSDIPLEQRPAQRDRDVFERFDILTDLQEWALNRTLTARTRRGQQVLQELNDWAQQKLET